MRTKHLPFLSFLSDSLCHALQLVFKFLRLKQGRLYQVLCLFTLFILERTVGVWECRCNSGSRLLHFNPPFRASAYRHSSSVIFIRAHNTGVASLQRGSWLVQLDHMESKYTESSLSILFVLLFQDGWEGGLDRSWWRSPLYHRFVAVPISFVSLFPCVFLLLLLLDTSQNLTYGSFIYIREQERRRCMQISVIFHLNL